MKQIPPLDILTLGSDGKITHTGSNKMLYGSLSEKLNFD